MERYSQGEACAPYESHARVGASYRRQQYELLLTMLQLAGAGNRDRPAQKSLGLVLMPLAFQPGILAKAALSMAKAAYNLCTTLK